MQFERNNDIYDAKNETLSVCSSYVATASLVRTFQIFTNPSEPLHCVNQLTFEDF